MRPLPRWPLLALYLGFPVWWLLGLGAFIWPVLAVPMLGALVLRGRIRFPVGFGLWFGFLVWMLGSAIELDSGARVLGWAYRASLYLSATVVFLYVYNASRDRLPPRTISFVLTGFWAFVVIGGYLGLALPHGSFATVVEHVMPRDLLANDFVQAMVHPAFAQTAGASLGVAPRPQAPFTYTNEWGGNFALLVPMVLTAISLGAGLVYAALRYAIRGRVKAMIGITVVVAVAGAVFAVLPVKQLLEQRLTSSSTNQTRASLYAEARDRVASSPLLGYGAPRPSEAGGSGPAVGTQGQFWMVLFSHGIPGAALFVGFYVWAVWRTRRALTPPWFWAHVTVVIGLLQLPIYGMLPAQLSTVMLAAAMALREEEALARRRAPARGRSTAPSTVETQPA